MSENLYKFSVLTPTYKGSDTIRIVFDSLKSQTFTDFEWLIVMDGYDDETAKVIREFQSEGVEFPIRSMSIEHNHKKAALNKGIKEASGELIIIADDDDGFMPEALAVFNETWDSITDKDRFVGVTGLCVYEDGSIVGDKFPADVFDATTLECSLKHRVKGEKWGTYRRDVLLQFPFFENAEGCIAESTVWFEIGKAYKTRYINRILRVYVQTDNSIIRGSFTSKKVEKNCQASTYGYLYSASQVGFAMLYNPMLYAICCINYVRFMAHSIHFNKYKPWMSPFESFSKLSAAVIGSPGVIFYLRDVYNFRKK